MAAAVASQVAVACQVVAAVPGVAVPAVAVVALDNSAAPVVAAAGNRGGNFNGGNNNQNSRYNMELFVSADNLFNNVNYGGYSGNQLSKFYLQPTTAQAARRVQIGMGFRF